MGQRPPSIVATDLTRETAKYREAHNKANESNQNLHRAVTTHVYNLEILRLPLAQIQQQIPAMEFPNSKNLFPRVCLCLTVCFSERQSGSHRAPAGHAGEDRGDAEPASATVEQISRGRHSRRHHTVGGHEAVGSVAGRAVSEGDTKTSYAGI